MRRLPGWMTAALLAVSLGAVSLPGRVQAHMVTGQVPRPHPLCISGPPAAVVRAYYADAVHHRAAAARACLAPALAETLRGSGAYAPWHNYVSARVTATRVRSVPPAFLNSRSRPNIRMVKLVQILVSVTMHYRHARRTPLHNGPNDLFFYVGKEYRGSPWRIVAIGAGP